MLFKECKLLPKVKLFDLKYSFSLSDTIFWQWNQFYSSIYHNVLSNMRSHNHRSSFGHIPERVRKKLSNSELQPSNLPPINNLAQPLSGLLLSLSNSNPSSRAKSFFPASRSASFRLPNNWPGGLIPLSNISLK